MSLDPFVGRDASIKQSRRREKVGKIALSRHIIKLTGHHYHYYSHHRCHRRRLSRLRLECRFGGLVSRAQASGQLVTQNEATAAHGASFVCNFRSSPTLKQVKAKPNRTKLNGAERRPLETRKLLAQWQTQLLDPEISDDETNLVGPTNQSRPLEAPALVGSYELATFPLS